MPDEDIPQGANEKEETPRFENIQNKEPIKLPPQLVEFIKTLPADEQASVKASVKAMFMALSIKQSSFRSPIPPPDILKGYNDIIPNGAERILSMTEKQSDHRMRMEADTIKEEQRQGSKGQNLGFTIGLVGLLVAGFAAYFGHDAFAGILGSTTIVGLVGVFVIGKYYQGKDLSDKKDS